MASPSDLPRSLRRAAARPAGPRGRQPSQRLRDAAAAGVLTRDNTVPGTAGRRAADAEVYGRRRAQRPDLPAREAAGGTVAGSRPADRRATFFTSEGGPRLVTLGGPELTTRDVQRAAAYMGEVGGLLHDLERARGNPARVAAVKGGWERRMAARAPIGGLPVLADADAAISLAEELRGHEGEDLVFDSGRSRPGRRRRTVRRPQVVRRGATSRGGGQRQSRRSGPGVGELIEEAWAEADEALAEVDELRGELDL